MPDASYWIKSIGRLWITGSKLRLTYISRDGSTKAWSGVLRSLGRDGPVIMWRGSAEVLCPWDKLISVEDARKEVLQLPLV